MYSCIDMLFLCSSKCSLRIENYFKNTSDNPRQMRFIPSKPNASGFLGVCESLTATNGCQIVCQRGTTIKSGLETTLFPSQWGHSYTLYSVLWRHKGGNSGPTQGNDAVWGGEKLQEVPRSGWATEGSRRWLQQRTVQILNYLATFLQRLINADTLWILW